MKKGWLIKILKKPLVKGVLKSVPFVGDVVDNITTETENSPAGSLDKGDLVMRIVRLVVLIGILYFVFSGKIDMEQAEDIKEFITD